MRLSGPALARFAGQVGARLGISVSGTAPAMASRLYTYVTSNPMSAGLVAASLAVSTPDFDIDSLIDAWEGNTDGHDMPDDIKYILSEAKGLIDNRNQVTGDQDEDTVMGIDVDDLRNAAKVLEFGDNQIRLLMRHFGNIDEVAAVRAAMFAVDDEQLKLYKERHGARRY
jgi:hypothetical protein